MLRGCRSNKQSGPAPVPVSAASSRSCSYNWVSRPTTSAQSQVTSPRHEIDAANATAILLLSSAAPTGGKRRSSPCLTCDLWLPPPPESRLRWRGRGGRRAKIASHSFYPAADLSRPTTKERWRSTDSCTTTGRAAHSPFPATFDALCEACCSCNDILLHRRSAVPSGGRRSPVAVGPLDRSMPNRTSIDSSVSVSPCLLRRISIPEERCFPRQRGVP